MWAYQYGVVLDFSRSGKPTGYAFIESFNVKFRAECLNTHCFMCLDDARQKWRSCEETTTKCILIAQS
ncbi:integrase core domain-containing protein [Shimia sp. R9_3]|nr:integrase core domain-containing protein [Shimia sp. R9_3]